MVTEKERKLNETVLRVLLVQKRQLVREMNKMTSEIEKIDAEIERIMDRLIFGQEDVGAEPNDKEDEVDVEVEEEENDDEPDPDTEAARRYPKRGEIQ